MRKQYVWLFLLLVLALGQAGCAALAGGVVGGAIGAEVADDDEEEDED